MTATLTQLPQLEVGATARFSKTITAEDVQGFATISGDFNPLHLDADFARKTTFGRPVVHGMLLGSFVSRMIGMQLPGAGALWMRQSFQWAAPVFVGDTVEITLKVTHKSVGSNAITLEVSAVNQNGKTVMSGDGAVRMLEQQQPHQPGRSLKEQVVLIGGGALQVGAAMAVRLAQEGAAVAVNSSMDEGAAMEIAASIRKDGGRAVAVHLDFLDSHSAKAGLDLIRQEFGRPVDVLINNTTALFSPRPFMDLSWESVQSLLDDEIRRAFHGCQAVLPGMMEKKSGCIVNIGSVLTRQAPPPQWTPFVVAKSALQGLTRSLASEFGPHGIRVNMVSLSVSDNDGSAGADRLRKVQAMQTPLRRLAVPEDVAQAVVFLCSEAGSFITGVDLPVAGGFSM